MRRRAASHDDYLAKPFHFPELVLRIRSLARRRPAARARTLRAGSGFLSAEQLLEQVWDENADPFTNTVAVTIGRLRRTLGGPPVIMTTAGVGYRVADAVGPGAAESRGGRSVPR